MTLDAIIDAIGIEPYNRTEHGVLYCADCLDILPKIPDKAIDLVLTDPPYNVSLGTKSHGFSKRQSGYSNSLDDIPRQEYVEWVLSWFGVIAKISDRIIITPGNSNQFIYPEPKWTMAWTKSNGCTRTPLTAGQKMMHSCWEPILVYGKMINPCKSDVINMPIAFQASGNGHPCPKPLKLIEHLILTGDESDIILDPFCGSGTTCVAAKQLGRKYIGIEISEGYCKICVERLRQEELF